MRTNRIKLGVNIDHVATVRQARDTVYPDPIAAAQIAIQSGADSITLHLREDRRHIQDTDVNNLKKQLKAPINLEMAVTEEMLAFAEKIQPDYCCLVPEKREELTTEGGLDILKNTALIKSACARLSAKGIAVSLFIDPSRQQIEAAKNCGAPAIELHTGEYANHPTEAEWQRLQDAANYAHELGLIVNAGHGIDYDNIAILKKIPYLNELNIGHSIVAKAIFIGMGEAVKLMKEAMS